MWTRGEYTISTDRSRLDLDVIHGYLDRSYWAQGRPRERVAVSIAESLPFGVYHRQAQVGFARVITDHVTLAFLADVFVLEEHRGRGLGTWLVEVVTSLPELQSVKRWLLGRATPTGCTASSGSGRPRRKSGWSGPMQSFPAAAGHAAGR